MRVLDHRRASWILFEEAGLLLLDVACDHSAVGYDVMIPLSTEEVAEYSLKGREFLDRLARDTHYWGPGNHLQRRDVSDAYSNDVVMAAIEKWREDHPEDDWPSASSGPDASRDD